MQPRRIARVDVNDGLAKRPRHDPERAGLVVKMADGDGRAQVGDGISSAAIGCGCYHHPREYDGAGG